MNFLLARFYLPRKRRAAGGRPAPAAPGPELPPLQQPLKGKLQRWQTGAFPGGWWHPQEMVPGARQSSEQQWESSCHPHLSSKVQLTRGHLTSHSQSALISRATLKPDCPDGKAAVPSTSHGSGESWWVTAGSREPGKWTVLSLPNPGYNAQASRGPSTLREQCDLFGGRGYKPGLLPQRHLELGQSGGTRSEWALLTLSPEPGPKKRFIYGSPR